MGKRAICTALFTAAALAMVPAKSFGLAALASGAKTSCKPTAPSGSPLYRTQVNCDPFGVTNFTLSFSYDASLLTFDGPVGINGYDVSATDVLDANGAPTGIIDMSGGTGNPPFSEQDVIGLQFSLKSSLIDISRFYDVPLHFQVFANSDNHITARDEDNPQDIVTFTGPNEIESSSADLSLNQIHAQADAVPLPASAWGGMLLLTGLGAFRMMRKPTAAKC